jgi:osmotically-inducible protein OsmY
MKNLSWVAPLLLSATFILPACEQKQDSRTVTPESSPTTTAPTPPAAKMSDADLEKAIRTKLESDDALKQAKLSVSAEAEDNKATISGTVVSEEMRAKAVDLAKSAHPGVTIEDKIDVKPAA